MGQDGAERETILHQTIPVGKAACALPETMRSLLAREQAARARAEAAVERLEAVEEVTVAALAHLSLDDLLHELLRRIRRVLAGDAARLLLLSEDGTTLEVRAYDGLGPIKPEDYAIPYGLGVAGRIAAAGQAMVFGDISQVEIISPVLRMGMRSLIGAPLVVEGRVIGVVDVETATPDHFSEDDLVLLQLVADRAALAIENARLYQQARFEQMRWQATVQGMLDPVAVSDAHGRLVYANAAYEQLTGLKVEQGIQPPVSLQLSHPDGTPFAPSELPLQRATRGEEARQIEIVQRSPDGVERVAVWNAAPLYENGHVIGAVTAGRDVTQERKAQADRERLLAEVRQRAAELDATLTSIADGLIIYSPQGEIVRMNPAAEDILGYSPAQRMRPMTERLIGLRMERATGQPFPVDEAPPRRAIRGERVHSVVVVLHPPTGRTVWVSASAAPIRTPDGAFLGAVMTFSDITRLHELQEQREDLLRAVSHDLRNPLAVVQAQAQLLLRTLDKAGLTAGHEGAEAILTSAQRMNSMIQDLVDSARLEAGQLPLRRQAVDLPAFTLDLKRRLASALETERIRVEAAADLPRAWADPDRLERILTNLLSNALKYSTPGTEVRVIISQRNHEAVIAVADQGPGIPPEELPHLFQRYYRTRAARRGREGLGLGLYITRMLVEAHGGHIWVESRVGVGSTFSFSLPIAPEDADRLDRRG